MVEQRVRAKPKRVHSEEQKATWRKRIQKKEQQHQPSPRLIVWIPADTAYDYKETVSEEGVRWSDEF